MELHTYHLPRSVLKWAPAKRRKSRNPRRRRRRRRHQKREPSMAAKRNLVWLLHMVAFLGIHISKISCSLSNASFPALILLGDSTLDTGNNDHLATVFKCDHPPYGRDFFEQQATGRCSDGSLALDYVAQALGLPPAIPYLDPNADGPAILTGINFASGGAGLLDDTSKAAGIIPLSKQLDWYFDYQNKLKKLVGKSRASYILSNALYVMSVATNDYILNFYLPPYLPHSGNISDFRAAMLQNYEKYLEILYEGGARILAIAGIPPMGCRPYTMGFYNSTHSSKCIEYMNEEAETFNEGLKSLLSELAVRLTGVKLMYIDVYNTLLDIVRSPQAYGFEVATRGCCGDGILAAGLSCSLATLGTCKDTQNYVFFDAFHPTQYTAKLLAKAVLSQLNANMQ